MLLEPCSAAARYALAEAIGESPWTAATVHLLRRGLCTVYAAGDPSVPAAAVVFWAIHPDRALVFGHDVTRAWSVLKSVPNWTAISIAEERASALSAVIERELCVPVETHSDMYHVLVGPPRDFSHPLVRRLTMEDIALIEDAPPLLQQGRMFGSPHGLLREGIITGAIDKGILVATAHTATLTDRYAAIGVATLERYRRQGIAAAAASLVCREVQAMEHTPVWDCAEDNVASLHLAQKLGFVRIGRRVNLIPAVCG